MLNKPHHIRPTVLIAAVALAVLVAAAGYGLSGGFDRDVTERVTRDGGATQLVRVELVDAVVGFDVTPDTLLVERGAHLVLDVVNAGDGPHDLAVDDGPRTRMLDAGESQRLDVGPVTTGLAAICTLPDHAFAGMTLEIRVAGA